MSEIYKYTYNSDSLFEPKEKDDSRYEDYNPTDPVTLGLAGEGHYALRDVKTVEVTEEFVGLGEKVTHCQTEEYRVDCLSSKYREKVLSQCQC